MDSEQTICGDLKISYRCPNTNKRHTRSVSQERDTGDISGATWIVYEVNCPCGETHTVEA